MRTSDGRAPRGARPFAVRERPWMGGELVTGEVFGGAAALQRPRAPRHGGPQGPDWEFAQGSYLMGRYSGNHMARRMVFSRLMRMSGSACPSLTALLTTAQATACEQSRIVGSCG